MFILAELLSIPLFLLWVVVYSWFAWKRHREQKKCPHDGGYGETQACDAICRKCGKNLGFIGNLRK